MAMQSLRIVTNDSSTSPSASANRYVSYDEVFDRYGKDIHRHYGMLSNVTPNADDVYPLLFIKSKPSSRYSSGTSIGTINEASQLKYEQLNNQLAELRQLETEDGIESGAIQTASNVIRELIKSEIAPPELSWMGSEAIIMLWMLGRTKYALTVTDGEVGYVVRAEGKTVRRQHGLSVDNLDVLRIP